MDGLDSATNSLYTENLLREMKVPGVRVEDVFKRVRLNVRLKSNGKQVPWESTSLEDDFTFFPAAAAPASKVPPDVSRDAARNEWEVASAAGTREALRAFLQKYPVSAHTADMQFRLADLYFEESELDYSARNDEYNRLAAQAEKDPSVKVPDEPKKARELRDALGAKYDAAYAAQRAVLKEEWGEIERYLVENSAEAGTHRASRKVLASASAGDDA